MNDEERVEWNSRQGFWHRKPTPLAEAIRQIPETKDPPTCRHGRTTLIPCSACDQFNKPLKEKE